MVASAPARRTPLDLLSGMGGLSDATRLRLLRLLEEHELGVASLCDVLQLPQSTVSRHLKVLSDLGFVAGRAQGTNRLYRMVRMERESPARRLWLLARGEAEAWAAARQDDLRLRRLLRAREPEAQAFFAGASGEWDRLREEAYGHGLNQTATLALLSPSSTVADLGCGTGALTAALAPHVARVVGVDQSAAMLKAARARTATYRNVELRRGSLAELPIEDASCDAALLVLALSYVPDTAPVLLEMARILKPGGRAVVMDVLRHDREDFQRTMGQAVPGFDGDELGGKMGTAGFLEVTCRPLPPEAGAKGPALLLATALRSGRPRPVSLDSRRTR